MFKSLHELFSHLAQICTLTHTEIKKQLGSFLGQFYCFDKKWSILRRWLRSSATITIPRVSIYQEMKKNSLRVKHVTDLKWCDRVAGIDLHLLKSLFSIHNAIRAS